MDKVVTIPGPETEQLGEVAREYGLYIVAGGVCEELSEFPDRWFKYQFYCRTGRRYRAEISQVAYPRVHRPGHPP